MKKKSEWIIIILVFVFSFYSNLTLFLALLLSLVLLYQKEIGALKVINLLTLRSIVNPGLGIDIVVFQHFKMLLIYTLSIYLILRIFKLDKEIFQKIKGVTLFFFLFILSNIFTSLMFSSLPTISLFKLVSYSIVFYGCLVGIAFTYKTFNWLKWLLRMFSIIIVSSALIITFPVSKLLNGVSLQGTTNHPNMFGIVTVLFLGVLFTNYWYSKKTYVYTTFFVALSFYLVILSKSRTAFLSCLFLLLIFTVSRSFKISSYLKLSILSIGTVFGILLSALTIPKVDGFLFKFMIKGQEASNFLHSRSEQISTALYNFSLNPLFGTGFSVPVLPFKSYSFSVDYVMEPGNLVLSVLFYSGIIGLLLFILFLSRILWVNKTNLLSNVFLFVSPLLISMGEMVFFSSNNIGIWCYMFLALYIFLDRREFMT
ncbi:MAG: O-antigen ligase family protein [Bacillota bacterium]